MSCVCVSVTPQLEEVMVRSLLPLFCSRTMLSRAAFSARACMRERDVLVAAFYSGVYIIRMPHTLASRDIPHTLFPEMYSVGILTMVRRWGSGFIAACSQWDTARQYVAMCNTPRIAVQLQRPTPR